eukprot:snap_masked-scaffold_8-processed-gene-9.59-mRNA-1 protein AED:1.00 eAED:1.00 QI:0/0/0/0/1/1/2/0/73
MFYTLFRFVYIIIPSDLSFSELAKDFDKLSRLSISIEIDILPTQKENKLIRLRDIILLIRINIISTIIAIGLF